MKLLLFIIVLIFTSISSFASHIVGGEMYYDYLGNNQYRIYISVYRDCHSDGANFDDPLPLGIFNASNNQRVLSLQVPFTGSANVPITFNNPCVIPPDHICTENAIYTTIVTLPPIPGGYRVAYVRCCRGSSINNLLNPGDTGLTITVNIPGIQNNAYQNSSPRFNHYPPSLLCNNDDLNFDHSATDPDGDELVYSLATPFQGGSSLDPMPVPTPMPPYIPVNWGGGYSQANPLGPGATISIDPTTGNLIASPNLTGRFVVGIRVSEYRNGVLISTMIRDFIFEVFNCNISMEAILPLETELPSYVGHCIGNLNVQFVNNSYGGTNYQWDFGDNTTTSDVSTDFQPTHQYPDTGTYVAMLVVNPGWPCTDTAYIELNLYDEINATIHGPDSLCFIDNEFDFSATSDGLTGTNYSWDFGINGAPANANGQNAAVHFNTIGVQQVILTSSFKTCEETDTTTVFVIPQPTTSIELPSNYTCDGLEVDFINNTQNATNHVWDFGIGGTTSNEASPSFTFPAAGTYHVTYYASSSPLCVDSFSVDIQVKEKLELSFTHSPNQCITSNVFDFIGDVSGPDDAIYTYIFDQGTSHPNVNDTSVMGLSYTTPGAHHITLIGQSGTCIDSISSDVFVYQSPTIGFTVLNELQCTPFNAQFLNYSTADTPMNFLWNFGDGTFSTEANPSHVYTQAGNYPVSLTLITTTGCIDTLFLSQVDLINVHPSPTAMFDVDKTVADICNSEIQFINQSMGASSYFYYFDDSGATSNSENPQYSFQQAGDHFSYLIVTSDHGCKDTAYQKIYIEPFSIFIPNTFTPNADNINDFLEAKMWLTPANWDFKLYNRWGEVIYSTTDYQFKWDGKINGRFVQDGLYNYTLKYKPCSEEFDEVFMIGHVNILK